MKTGNVIATMNSILLAAGMLAVAPALAQQEVKVSNAWVRATVPGQSVGGVYMDIVSPVNARLVSASSPAAAKVEIHNMTMDKGVMKMFPVDGIDLPAGKTVKLAPGGYHVMLIDLKKGIAKGDATPVTLIIEDAKKTRQTVVVKAEAREGAAAAHKGH